MGIFDNIGSPAVQNAQQSSGNRTEDIVLQSCPIILQSSQHCRRLLWMTRSRQQH